MWCICITIDIPHRYSCGAHLDGIIYFRSAILNIFFFSWAIFWVSRTLRGTQVKRLAKNALLRASIESSRTEVRHHRIRFVSGLVQRWTCVVSGHILLAFKLPRATQESLGRRLRYGCLKGTFVPVCLFERGRFHTGRIIFIAHTGWFKSNLGEVAVKTSGKQEGADSIPAETFILIY